MKKTYQFGARLGITLCGALLGCSAYGQPSISVDVSIPLPSVEVGLPGVEIRAESDFYEPLTPYGRWEVIGDYGRCWIPGRVDAGWRPYSDGYWQRTDAGWYWCSSEPWGWATYHYGRWDMDARLGWYWMPQTQWAPAWVSWNRGGGYIGWAPLNHSARFRENGSWDFGGRAISPHAYVFVEQRRFLDPIRRNTVFPNSATIMRRTSRITSMRMVNHSVFNEGPATGAIERDSGRKIQPAQVRDLRHREESGVAIRHPGSPMSRDRESAPPIRNSGPSVNRDRELSAPARNVAPSREARPAPGHEPFRIGKPVEPSRRSVTPAPQVRPTPNTPRNSPPVAPGGRNEGNHSPSINAPAPQNPDKRPAIQNRTTMPSEKNAQGRNRETPASGERNRPNNPGKDRGNK